VNHHGSRDEIAQAFVLGIQEHGDDAHRVNSRQLIDDAEQVARDRIVDADRTAVVADDAQAGQALAGRLAVPNRLEKGEIAFVKEECGDRQKREHPLRN